MSKVKADILTAVELRTRRYFDCIECGKHEFLVEHLFKDAPERGSSAGPWYCDECGLGHEVKAYPDGRVSAGPTDRRERLLPTSVVLRLPPQSRPVYFLVKGMRFTDEKPDEGETQEEHNQNRDRYFYEEHTCPTNWMRDVVEVMIGDDCDPHGLWEHIGTVEAPPGNDPNDKQLLDLLRSAALDGGADLGLRGDPGGYLKDQIAAQQLEIDRRGRLIEEQERELGRLREELGRRC